MKNSFKKIISLSTLLLIFINPILIFAVEGDTAININSPFPTNSTNAYVPTGNAYNPQNPYQFNPVTNINNPYSPNSPNLNPQFVNTQIQNSVLATPSTTTRAQTNSAVQQGATGIASCLGSQIVAQAIVQNVNSFANNAVSKVTDSLINVPVAEGGSTGGAIKTETSARVGTGISLFGFSIPTMPSWDSMAYCIVNTMIIYIADSTIAWVNSGFEGNPAFLNNPDQFFKDLANQEKIAFLQGLAYGVNSSVCGVYKSSVLSAILTSYGRNQQRYGQPGYQNGGYGQGGVGMPMNSCAFDQKPGQLNLFLRGGFTQGGGWNSWFEITQNPINNPYDTYFNSVDRLGQRVQTTQASQERELNWNNGYLSFRKCENGEKDKSKCPITTPGKIVSSQLEKTLNLGKDRLVLAEKFDQVVTAIIDQLITTALDKTLTTVNEAMAGESGNQNMWSSPDSNPYTNPKQSTTTNNNTNSSSTSSTSTSTGANQQNQGPATTNYEFRNNLGPDKEGNEILELRKFLIAQGHLNPSANTSNRWDGDLSNAVFQFQNKHRISIGIVEVGYFGGDTRKKANDIQGF